MALSNTQIQKARPGEKSYRLYDEKGLYLEVAKSGGKLWRLKYRFRGKEKRLALGAYPAVSLRAARDARDTARTQLANSIDPSAHKKAQKAALTAAARDYSKEALTILLDVAAHSTSDAARVSASVAILDRG